MQLICSQHSRLQTGLHVSDLDPDPSPNLLSSPAPICSHAQPQSEVRDGSSASAPLIATVSGAKTRRSFLSRGSDMHVAFASDSNKQSTGAELIFRAYQAGTGPPLRPT